MSKRIGGVIAVLIALAVFPATGHAEGAKYTLSMTKDYTASPWTSETGWSSRAVGKLGFGAKNLLLGWTELFTEPKAALDEGGNFFVGLGRGLWNGLADTLGGAVHVVTFPITAVDAPLPQGGVQLFQ